MERKLGTLTSISGDEVGEEFPYGFRFQYEDPLLEASIKARGILSPLLWTYSVDQRPVLVSGHRRFFAARHLGRSQTPALFLEETIPAKELFLLSLYSNWNQNFPELDRMQAIHQAETTFGFTLNEVRQDILPALGLPPSRRVLEEYRRASQLTSDVHQLICSGKIPFRGASRLTLFRSEEQTFLAHSVFSKVHLTANQLSLLLEWLFELGKIRAVSLPTLFSESGFQEILSHPGLDARARGEKLFKAIRVLRFPRISEEERSFSSLNQKMEAEGIVLERPLGSEKDEVLLKARIKNRESLRRILRVIETHRQSFDSFLS